MPSLRKTYFIISLHSNFTKRNFAKQGAELFWAAKGAPIFRFLYFLCAALGFQLQLQILPNCPPKQNKQEKRRILWHIYDLWTGVTEDQIKLATLGQFRHDQQKGCLTNWEDHGSEMSSPKDCMLSQVKLWTKYLPADPSLLAPLMSLSAA